MNSWIVDESKWLIINLVGLIQYFDADFSFSAIPIERGTGCHRFRSWIVMWHNRCVRTPDFCHKSRFFFCVPKQLLWIFRFFKILDLLFNIYFKNWQKYTYRQDVLFLMCHFLSSGDGDVGREGAWGGSDMSPNCISCGKTIVLWRVGCFDCGFCANLNSRNGVIDNCLHSLKCCKSV